MTYDWIPVTEKRPNFHECVLVAVRGLFKPALGWLGDEDGGYPYWIVEYNLSQWTEELERVTHWLPMPKMPGKEEAKC